MCPNQREVWLSINICLRRPFHTLTREGEGYYAWAPPSASTQQTRQAAFKGQASLLRELRAEQHVAAIEKCPPQRVSVIQLGIPPMSIHWGLTPS